LDRDAVNLRCSGLPMFLACAHSQDALPLLIEAHNGASDLGNGAHDAMRSIVKDMPVDVEAMALRHFVDPKELGPLVTFGYKAWDELRDAFPLPETEVEVALPLSDEIHLSGHIDLLSVVLAEDAHHGRFIDWKSGRKESSDYYAQMAGYATALILSRGLADATGTVVWLRSQTIETFRFTQADALAFVERLGAHVRNGRYRHGEHCAYCPRSHDCPALVAVTRRDAAMFAMGAEVVDALVQQAPPAVIVDARRRLKVIETFAESFDKACRRRIRAEGPLDSGDGTLLSLVEENGKREVDTEKAWPILQDMLGDDLASCVTVSAARADEVVAKKAGKGKGAAAKRALAAALEEAGAVTQPKIPKLKEVRKDRALPDKETA
jgi:hypothetical protein